MKLSSDKVIKVKDTLMGIRLMTEFYILDGKSIYRINKKGMQYYITLLHLLGTNKIMNGPDIDGDRIRTSQTNKIQEAIIGEGFVDYMESKGTYELTRKGAECIYTMFELNDTVGLVNWFGKLIKKLKG